MSPSASPEWIAVPGWEAYPWLRAGFSTRQGGVSEAYGANELNLGWTPEDPAANTTRNRQAFLKAVAGTGDAGPLVTLRQVHGASVLDLESLGPDGLPLSSSPVAMMTPEGKARVEGDGLVTRTANLWIGAITADCTPVLLVDTRLRAVGSFHAGWRGTVAGIVREGVATMRQGYGSRPEDLRAAIGPCIGSCCFEVGEEVIAAFRHAFGEDADRLITAGSGGKARIDLQAANRHWLQTAGVTATSITTIEACTACERMTNGERRFFSHRAEKGVTGRMLNVIAVRSSGD